MRRQEKGGEGCGGSVAGEATYFFFAAFFPFFFDVFLDVFLAFFMAMVVGHPLHSNPCQPTKGFRVGSRT